MSYKILVIDHDPDSFEGMLRPLTEAGYEVVVATDASQGLDTFEQMQPDLAMIEALLPQKSGSALCQELKSTESGKATPIVLMHESESSDSESSDDFESSGCDRLLARPITDAQLLAICEALIRKSAKSEDDAGEPEAEQEAKPTTDGLLNNAELGDALGKLNLIIEDKTSTAEETAPEAGEKNGGRAEARGDFSAIADELSSQPAPAAPSQVTIEQVESPKTTEISAAEVEADDDSGADIVERLDSLFGGTPLLDEDPGAAADVEAIAPTTSDQTRAAEPVAPVNEIPASESTATGPKTVRESVQTGPVAKPGTATHTFGSTAAVAAAATSEKVRPIRATPIATTSSESKIRPWHWIAAAAVAVLLIGGAAMVFFPTGSSGDATTTAVAQAETPAAGTSGSSSTGYSGLRSDVRAATAREPGAAMTAPPVTTTSALPAEASATESTTSPDPAATPPAVVKPTAVAAAKPKAAKPQAAAPKTTTPVAKPKAAAPKTTTAAAKPKAAAPKTTTPAAKPQAATPKAETPAAKPKTTAPKTTTPTPAPLAEPPATVSMVVASTPRPAEPPTSIGFSAPSPIGFHEPAAVKRTAPVIPTGTSSQDGTVVVNVLVDETGKIVHASVDQGIPDSGLDQVALDTVRNWTFRPAFEEGSPIKAWTKARVEFTR